MSPLQIIFIYTRKYRPALALAAFSMLALVGVQLLVPWIIRMLIATVTAPGATLGDMDLVSKLTIAVFRNIAFPLRNTFQCSSIDSFSAEFAQNALRVAAIGSGVTIRPS